MTSQVDIGILRPGNAGTLRGMLALFCRAFDDPAIYVPDRPGDAYLERLLCGETFIAIGASVHGKVGGGLAAYLLAKFGQPRSGFTPSPAGGRTSCISTLTRPTAPPRHGDMVQAGPANATRIRYR